MEEKLNLNMEEEKGLIEWLDTVLKRWKIAVIVSILILCLGLYYSYLKMKKEKPVYTSAAVVMIGPESLEVTTQEGKIIKQVYSYADELTLLKSDIIAKQAANIMKNKFGYKDPENKLILEIKEAVQANPTKAAGQNTITISASSDTPKRALDTVLAVIDGYRQQKRDDENRFFKETYRTFSEQLDIARESLHNSEMAVTDFILKNEDLANVIKNYGLTEKESGEPSGINEKYLSIKSEILEMENYINSVRNLAARDRLAALNMIAKKYEQAVDLELKKTLADKEEELDGLLLINEEAHPQVIRVRGELRGIEVKIDAQILNGINIMEADLKVLKSKEEDLSRLIAEGIHQKILTYNNLKRDIIVKRDIYNKLSEEMQQLNVGEKIRRYREIRILEAAKIPGPWSFSKRYFYRNILLSLMMAIFTGIASVYVLDLFDTSIKDVEQLERLVDIPVLASIPLYKKYKPKEEPTPKKE